MIGSIVQQVCTYIYLCNMYIYENIYVQQEYVSVLKSRSRAWKWCKSSWYTDKFYLERFCEGVLHAFTSIPILRLFVESQKVIRVNDLLALSRRYIVALHQGGINHHGYPALGDIGIYDYFKFKQSIWLI